MGLMTHKPMSWWCSGPPCSVFAAALVMDVSLRDLSVTVNEAFQHHLKRRMRGVSFVSDYQKGSSCGFDAGGGEIDVPLL